MTSIRDIAQMAGVSAASVSRILNNDPAFSINENTRQRVIEIANSLNYSTDKNKRGTRSVGDDLTIGLIVRHNAQSEFDDPYFRDIRRGIEQEAAKWRLKTIQAFRMRDEKKDWDQLKRYGAVIMISEMTKEATEYVSQLNPNLILVDNYSKNPQFDCIQTDFATKTREILDVLYEKGHQNIAFIGGSSSCVTAEGDVLYSQDEVRAMSYIEWMKLHNLEAYIRVLQGSWKTETGLQLAAKLLNEENRPTALVVGSDPLSVGVYRAISEAGLSIPEDISIISFDDNEMSKFMIPALSSVRMNAEEVGRIAVRMAKERILKERTMPIRVVCGSELRLRESVKEV
ncbi:LacI family DNA-binding transcriptional regulator [Listeria ilorinensis]|uniref:LacI family DNA-binding transcriptional regulator n=1 Tax=Listeria ilorinensis TaxID=2867439 RepID=UPI001EF6E3BA|nr:LacI family DNA-binding transcriptional regulator [Listeria ilorinensis]